MEASSEHGGLTRRSSRPKASRCHLARPLASHYFVETLSRLAAAELHRYPSIVIRPSGENSLNQTAMADPEQVLHEGCAILDPLLHEHGFKFVSGVVGRGSGGRFARGTYVRGDRRLDLSFRYSLGLVTYRVGDLSLAHDDYIRAVSGSSGAYPAFSSDPLDGFRHLREDLARHGGLFFSGSAEAFAELVKRAGTRPVGFKGLSRDEET